MDLLRVLLASLRRRLRMFNDWLERIAVRMIAWPLEQLERRDAQPEHIQRFIDRAFWVMLGCQLILIVWLLMWVWLTY